MTVEDHINNLCQYGTDLEIVITRDLIKIRIKTINGRCVAEVPRDEPGEDVSEKLARLLSYMYVEDKGYTFQLEKAG